MLMHNTTYHDELSSGERTEYYRVSIDFDLIFVRHQTVRHNSVQLNSKKWKVESQFEFDCTRFHVTHEHHSYRWIISSCVWRFSTIETKTHFRAIQQLDPFFDWFSFNEVVGPYSILEIHERKKNFKLISKNRNSLRRLIKVKKICNASKKEVSFYPFGINSFV